MRLLLPPPVRRRRRPPSPLSRRLALLVAFVATAACAHHARPKTAADDEDAPMPIPEFVYVTVENHNFNDVIIWLVQPDGMTSRIGTVTGSSNAVLKFRGIYIVGGGLQLIARPIGGRQAVRSERFSVQPGQQVSWTIETSLQRSSLAVY